MNTKQRIAKVVEQFNKDVPQANFESSFFRESLTEAIYDAVMKQDSYANSSTYNDTQTHTQMVLFSNLDDKENK